VAEHVFAGLRCADVLDLAPAFVLGALEPAESDAVRRHLAECPEAHAEVAELNSVIPALFESVDPVAPPAGLKERILAAAATEQAAAETSRPPAPPVADRSRPVAEAPRRAGWTDLFRRPVWGAVGVAAIAVAIALGAWNLQLQNQLAGLSAYRNGVLELLDEAGKPGTQLAVLVSQETGGPSGLASVSGDGRIQVVMRNLQPTAGTEVYETWVIGADGTPVAVGGFVVAGDGTASFVTARAGVEQGVTIALTREPRRGATTPTLPIVAAGKAQAQSS
jgi:anti-sigma-K factor RskA